MLRCVIFDLDNTLVDSALDFSRIKAEIGTDQPILEYRAAADCALCPGARELLDFLRVAGLRSALLTRNSRASVRTVLARHTLAFDVVLAREDSPPKPDPEPVRIICRRLGLQPADCLMVGDYLTTAGASLETDRHGLKDMGFTLE